MELNLFFFCSRFRVSFLFYDVRRLTSTLCLIFFANCDKLPVENAHKEEGILQKHFFPPPPTPHSNEERSRTSSLRLFFLFLFFLPFFKR